MGLLDSYYESAYLESWSAMTILSEECRIIPVTRDSVGIVFLPSRDIPSKYFSHQLPYAHRNHTVGDIVVSTVNLREYLFTSSIYQGVFCSKISPTFLFRHLNCKQFTSINLFNLNVFIIVMRGNLKSSPKKNTMAAPLELPKTLVFFSWFILLTLRYHNLCIG